MINYLIVAIGHDWLWTKMQLGLIVELTR